ncbi:hypothetical protein B0G57_1092 [Trinickia symbiotica]|uniref:hypothetical protein n=1 Tax=Trinickia symbiotica TaxID=863227 RepID=UPI000D4D946A|nr:hypothetical protein [Trinickia symbiotica]PPK44169.1 hypothetical protein B0G57_1092 [Trinickia symbiotica]
MQEAVKQVEVEQISAEEWRRTHRDFKTTIDGQRYVLRWTTHGTSLVPVTVVKEKK